MTTLRLLASAALVLTAPAHADGTAVAMPAWMAGGWIMQSEGDSWSEEWWTSPKAGLMMGAGRSGKASQLDWWEHTRIEEIGGTLRFCALPKGQEGACFNAVSVAPNAVTFENPAHDFPTRVAYRREGDELVAEISGKDGANAQRWRFKRIN